MSSTPRLSYFDHPPMVALVGAVGLKLTGDPFSLFGLRVGFILLFAGSTWLMARLATRFYGAKAGVLAALALSASGYFGMAVGTIAQPDGPLLFFWLLTLDRLAVALDDPDRIMPWLGVGVAWGGAMLSKYHAVLLPVGALLHMLFWPQARRCLRKPGPYLAAAIGLMMFTPVIAWNATHHWASFLFQGGRAAVSHQLQLDQLGAALGAEALFLFPWLWIGMVLLLVKLIRRGPRAWDESESFLISQAAPALVLFHAIAAQRRIMPYWPLFGFIALMPLLGRAWADGLKTRPASQRRRIIAIALFPVLLAGLASAQARFGLFEDSQGRLLGLVAPKHDPDADRVCWDQVANELARRGLLNEPRTFLFTDSWERAPGSPSPRAARPPWPATTTSKLGATHFGAVPKTGWAATESSSRLSEFPVRSRTTTSSSRDMNRSAPCKSSAAVFFFARSISTAARIRSVHFRSTAASRIGVEVTADRRSTAR